jgi:two-component system, NtrC family, C4-dicarboxylate transport response regulator DctD
MKRDLTTGPVILVEDDALRREATQQTLELAGLDVQAFESAARAARYIMPSFAGCIITDIRMEGMDGLQLFAKVMEIDPEIPVILVTGHGDIGMAVRAMHHGAFDFIAKPFGTDHLALVVRRALNARQLVTDNRSLRIALSKPSHGMIAESRVMMQLLTTAGQVARTQLDIAIEGETGTGKEMLARLIHKQSARHAAPFVAVAGLSLGPDIGFDQINRQTNGGTLFLDLCDELTLAAQAVLVGWLNARDRAIQHKGHEFTFQMIASSARPLFQLRENGGFRDDLFHRLNAIVLHIPPLRQRREDILALFAKFVSDAIEQTGKKRFDMSAFDRKRLLENDWLGNARELKSYAFGAVLNLPRRALLPQELNQSKGLAKRVSDFEQMVITEALQATGGNVVKACALLGTPRKTLYEKLTKYGVEPSRFRRFGERP